ncbi:MAG: hypothetical protein A2X56_04360 [Nitrospirae bacterium GWC2_57_13]|nr:MAG: hypothetical protein A2X56_04360 [Nitrospirae bacterium GWC2_57_13]OGW44505.1 MAG: hypothetical protein A2X57_05970 [Nitrospirae bacterium GWD2_57_8]
MGPAGILLKRLKRAHRALNTCKNTSLGALQEPGFVFKPGQYGSSRMMVNEPASPSFGRAFALKKQRSHAATRRQTNVIVLFIRALFGRFRARASLRRCRLDRSALLCLYSPNPHKAEL